MSLNLPRENLVYMNKKAVTLYKSIYSRDQCINTLISAQRLYN